MSTLDLELKIAADVERHHHFNYVIQQIENVLKDMFFFLVSCDKLQSI